jgi:putative membrane protein
METTMERRSFLLAVAALGLAGTEVHARTVVRDFRIKDLTAGTFAMSSSRLALTKTGNRDVIRFAHAEIAEQVRVATALGAAPGAAPLRPDHAALFEQLDGAPFGGGFDRIYVQGQIAGHRETLALNESYLRSGRNPREQEVAQMSLPIIHRHLGILNNLREMA